MPTNVLLLGRTGIVLDDVEAHLDVHDIDLFAGTNLNDVQATMAAEPIDHVIMGAGIDLDTRLAIIRHIFDTSTSTTVHMKDRDSGPAGMIPFVNAILTGLQHNEPLPNRP